MSEEIVKNTNIPNILWAQTLSKIYLTVMVTESKNNTFQVKDGKRITFECLSEETTYKFEFELDDLVKEYSMNITNRKITISLDKDEEGWWMKLTDDSFYKNNIKVDWDRWQDEEEDEDEEVSGMGGMPGMESMMGGMPGMESMMGGMPGMESMMGGMPGMEEMFKNMSGDMVGTDEDDDEDDEDDEDDDEDEDINTEGLTDMMSDIAKLEVSDNNSFEKETNIGEVDGSALTETLDPSLS